MNIDFRDTITGDIDFVLELENKEENARFIGAWPYQKHEESLSNPDIKHLIIYDTDSNNSIGYIILKGIKSENNALEIMRIVSSIKGKGVGRKSLEKLKRFAFEHNDFNRLWLDVRTDNDRAKYLYESCGFKVEAKLRECIFSNDKYHSLYLLSIIKKDFN